MKNIFLNKKTGANTKKGISYLNQVELLHPYSPYAKRALITLAETYYAEKDFENNVLIVAQGHDHPSLFHKQLLADQIHWISGLPPDSSNKIYAKIRYRQKDQACILSINNNQCIVDFKEPQFAIAPGQSVVFYNEDECLGGAIIDSRK